MGISLLQEKIEYLHSLADHLLHIGDDEGYVYVDDLSLLNKKIHESINELYPLQGGTSEQEASRCLAILKGYSVGMYANLDDERKRQDVLSCSRNVLPLISGSSLEFELHAFCV